MAYQAIPRNQHVFQTEGISLEFFFHLLFVQLQVIANFELLVRVDFIVFYNGSPRIYV